MFVGTERAFDDACDQSNLSVHQTFQCRCDHVCTWPMAGVRLWTILVALCAPFVASTPFIERLGPCYYALKEACVLPGSWQGALQIPGPVPEDMRRLKVCRCAVLLVP